MELGRQLIAMNATGLTTATSIDVNVEGGKLAVSFDKKDNRYTNVFLIGPAEFVLKDHCHLKNN
jgi:diaminopimelate epimerase